MDRRTAMTGIITISNLNNQYDNLNTISINRPRKNRIYNETIDRKDSFKNIATFTFNEFEELKFENQYKSLYYENNYYNKTFKKRTVKMQSIQQYSDR